MPDSPTRRMPESKPEPDLSGRKLGDYQLLRRLGRGGMADVYLAEQGSLRRQVAFKVLKSNLAQDDLYVRRFHHEAQAAASLVHANIVQIHEVGCIDGFHFIAQEYVPGGNLKQLISRRGPVDAPVANSVIRQVAAALHKAAEQGIIHRDIKPENIMLTSSGEVKVTDFGLARVTSDGHAVDLTQVGVTMGTPLYMSPEQVEGRQLDPRSDIYSFGVTCYQMLTGRPPFEGETALSVAVQHLKNEPERLENIRSDLPSGLCRVVHRMLAKDPAKRYQRASELLRDLRALQIEDSDEPWTAELEEWSTPELLALADSRIAATQELDKLMKSEALRIRRTPGVAYIVTGVTFAFLVGGGIAWWNRPPSLLAIPQNERPEIDRQESPRLQYLQAVLVDSLEGGYAKTEEAFLSVIQLFPPEQNPTNAYYANRARQRLAELYVQYEELPKALEQYEALASLGSSDPEFAAFGLVGRANIYAQRGAGDQATEAIGSLIPLIQQLDDPQKAKILEQLNPELREPLQKFIPELDQRELSADET